MEDGETLLGAALVSSDGIARQHYELVHLSFTFGGEAECVNLILIAQVASGGIPSCRSSSSLEPHRCGEAASERSVDAGNFGRSFGGQCGPPTRHLCLRGPPELWVGILDPRARSRLLTEGGGRRRRKKGAAP